MDSDDEGLGGNGSDLVEPTEHLEPGNKFEVAFAPAAPPPGGGGPPAGPDVAPTRGWWIAPVVIIAIIAIIGIIGAAIDDTPNSTSGTAATTVATTVTTINFATATTAPSVAETTTTIDVVAAVTAPTTTATTTNSGVANRPLSISAAWSNQTPQVGEQVVFDVQVSDPDASPIGECGGSPPGGFGDAGYAPGCQVSCDAPSRRERGDASYRYVHTYSSPGTYVVRFSYQSAGGCTSANPYASQRTIEFDITVHS